MTLALKMELKVFTLVLSTLAVLATGENGSYGACRTPESKTINHYIEFLVLSAFRCPTPSSVQPLSRTAKG
jgi:hypothetical protein